MAFVAAGSELPAQDHLDRIQITATAGEDIRRAVDMVGQMRRARTLRPVDVVLDSLVPGRMHQRLVQYHDNVRLKGGDVRVQTHQGATVTVFGHLHLDIDVITIPQLTSDEAWAIALEAGEGRAVGPPTLALVRNRSAQRGTHYLLVYEVRTFEALGPVVREIDAHTGAVISTVTLLRAQDGRFQCPDCAIGQGRGAKGDLKKISVRRLGGSFVAEDGLRRSTVSTYDLRGDWNYALDILNARTSLTTADLGRDADNDWEDAAAIDAHTGTGWTLDYLRHRFNREGLDGDNGPVTVLVHPIRRSDFFTVSNAVSSLFHLNAFYCEVCADGVLLFGEGLPVGERLAPLNQTVDFFSSALDIVAHEIGHAVADFSAQFVYEGESGALTEAFSDLLGLGTEFFIAESGRHADESADYLIGEDVLIPGGIRSISNPRSMGDPDHYDDRFKGTADNRGVHTNSTIVTHVYYLTIEGGTHDTSGVHVEGLGTGQRALVEQIFYRALTLLLPTDATFAMARDATVQSARDLSSDPAVAQTFATAWSAVGVE